MGELKPDLRDQTQDYVFEKFHSINFKIEEFPELFERVIELANMPESHFNDAVKMSEIVELLWDDIKKDNSIEFSLHELKLACLFHDIGKSGPADATLNERKIIEEIFDPTKFNVNSASFLSAPEFEEKNYTERSKEMKNLSIRRALEIEGLNNPEATISYLEKLKLHIYRDGKIVEENLDLDKHTMIELWREHDYWTFDVLNKFGDDKISEELIIVASTHHTLEGHDPGMLDGEVPDEAVALETIDKYSIITLVDKYQAFIERSEKMDHDIVIRILKSIIDFSKKQGIINHGDTQYNQFIKYWKILKDNEEKLTKMFKK